MMIKNSTPAEEGDGCQSCWNNKNLKHVLEDKFGSMMSLKGVFDILKRWVFS